VTASARASRFPPRARALAGSAVVAAALILAFTPLSAPWIQRVYANGLHPVLQRGLTRATNLVPFALGDLVFAAAILALSVIWVKSLRAAGRIGLARAVGLLLFRTAVLAAGAYLAFLLCWGLNYRRLPLSTKLDDDPARVTPAAARALAARTIRLLDADGALAHQTPWPDDADLVRLLAPAFDDAARSVGDRRGIVPAFPKTSIGDAFLGASGTAGFTHPITHEVVLDRTVLDCEKPFLLAHEWGHLAGFADESEASFVGLLACARSASPQIRYAGWLALYEQLPSEAVAAGPLAPVARETGKGSGAVVPSVGATEAGALSDAMPVLSPLVKADLRAIAARAARRRVPWISRISTRTYDRYLKANRVEAGVASYGLVVRLVLGVRFGEAWVPAPRPASGADSPAPRR
jgi:hypothetical protein